ncbi:MAG: DUF4080 domain-containing protein [Limisphaerales bacterium]
MPDILLCTLNAKFIHASFGLRYLFANLGELENRAAIAEFEIKQTPLEIVEALLAQQPRVIGLGVYIWNVRPSFEVVALLKRLRPEIRIVLGGPEVSHETGDQEIVALADHTITGEADLAFADLCRKLLDPGPADEEPPPRILQAPLPDPARVRLPYAHYTADDLAHRILYVEASRGCPFTCEFCLSSLDIPVRQFPLEPFLASLRDLLERGARQFKFVDRTFNLNLSVSRAILRFFRQHWRDGLFLHFEMIPDRLPEALREEIAWFPPGTVQLEIGIQSFNPEVCALISRRQDVERTEANFRFLRGSTGVHIHADLIVGLPGEILESFGAGFDRLLALRPQEIQVGILKRLRGTPISRHDEAWAMRYSPHPPYEILENRLIDFVTMQRLRRFARYWDLVANSGRFAASLPLVWSGGASPFQGFLNFSDWLHARLRQTHAIAQDRLARALLEWLIEEAGVPRGTATEAVIDDWRRLGRRDLPEWLGVSPRDTVRSAPEEPRGLPARQARHAQGSGG